MIRIPKKQGMNYGISSSLHHLAQGIVRKRIGRKGTKEGVFIDPSGIVKR